MQKQSVFISYSSEDAEWALSFAQALEKRGLTVWSDRTVDAGESLPDAIETGLRNSDVLVALYNPDSSSKPNVFFELGAAIGMGKQVVSIIPQGRGVVPLDVRSRRYLIRNTPEQTAEEFATSLQAA